MQKEQDWAESTAAGFGVNIKGEKSKFYKD